MSQPEFDVDAYFDEHMEELRGEMMDAFRQLHAVMENTIDSLGRGDAVESLDQALERVEKLEHVILSARAAEALWADLDEAMGEES